MELLPKTDLRNKPMLLPAAAFAAGTLLAFQASYLSIPLLAALGLAGLAFGRRSGVCVAFLACGVLVAAVRLGLPGDPAASFRRDHPVEAVVQVSGHWIPDDAGWSAPARIVRLRQGDRLTAPPIEVILHLPDPEEFPPAFGTTLRVKGYLAHSPGLGNRLPAPPGPWRLRVKSRQLVEAESPPGPVARLSGAIRRRVEEAFQAAGPAKGQGKALARALVLGDVSELPLPWKRGLRITGIYHLMSVSGIHVALVAGLVWLLGGWLPRPLRLLSMLAAIVLYLLLVGPLPSLVRSAVMGGLAVLALLAERPPAAANALSWAVILMLLDQPDLALSPAFQLTVSATAGLLLLAPALARRWQGRWIPPRFAEGIAASVGAHLATFPWAVPRFHMLSPMAFLLNLPAVPWTGLALIVSLAWTAVALMVPKLAGRLLPVLDVLAAPFSWPSRTPPEVWLPTPLALSPVWAWGIAIGITLVLLLLPRRRAFAILGISAVLLFGVLRWRDAGPRDPTLVMIDVGQGDSILLRDGDRAILVDGGGSRGGDIGGRALLPALLGEGIDHLDALVMTHPDNDHCGGLVDIAAYLPVREVWMAPGWDRQGCAGRLLDLPGVRPRFLWRGQRIAVGRWRLTALHPAADDDGPVNERSLVLLAEANGRRALLTGDIEKGAERELVDCCARDLRADLLKVAHHGSRTSSTEDFLGAVAPHLALISVGVDNVYHHPSPEIVERLKGRSRLLRTDRAGEIVVRFGRDRRLRLELPGEPKSRTRRHPRLVSENGPTFELLDKGGPRLQLVRLDQGAFAGGGRALTGSLPDVFGDAASGLIRVIDRELVIRFRPGLSGRRRRSILSPHGLVVCRRNRFIPEQRVAFQAAGRVSGEELIRISNALTQLEEVILATPNFLSEYRRQIPPAVLPAEWHLRNQGWGSATEGEDLNIDAAWRVTTGRQEVVVAVLDDGVDVDHPNLKASLWKNPDHGARDVIGRDFCLPDDHPDHFNPRPKRFRFPFDQAKASDIHGTPCAGLVAACGSWEGSVGVAPGCRVLPVKIFHGDSLASDERVADAIRYAAVHADVLTCSWSGGLSLDVEQALEDAGRLGRGGCGAAVFCAAGNDFGGRVAFPARSPHAIAIGASTDQARRAAYSNIGPEVALVAPSSGGIRAIFTTDVSLPKRGFNPDGLHTARFGGTSAATPLAAGVAALVLSVDPTLSRTEVKDLLVKTADKIGGGYDARGHSDELGFGRINAGRAVEAALRRVR